MARRLRDTFSRTPTIDTLLSSLLGQQEPPALSQVRRRSQGRDAQPEAEPSGRHAFVLQVFGAYCNGSTQQQIAAELGVHVQTIRATLRNTGVTLSERNATFSDEELETIRQLHADGISARELGCRYSVAHATILRQLR